MAPPASDWVIVARVGSTRGIRGELYATGWNRLERYASIPRMWLRRPGGEILNQGEPLQVERAQPYKGGLILKFAGVDSVEAAVEFVRSEAVVPVAERPTLPEGEMYLADLLDCEVFERSSGRKLGRVTGWQEFGGPELLEVSLEAAGSGDPVWIPFVRAICVEIDPARGRLVVDPPEGLIELNSSPE